MEIKNFIDIEEKYNLYNRKALEIRYWVYSRNVIWEEICKLSEQLGTAHNLRKMSGLERIADAIHKAGNICKSFWKTRLAANRELCILNHERRIKIDDFYVCAYTEELAKYFKSSIVVERPYQGRHLTPTPNNNVVYADYFGLKANISYHVNKLFRTKQYRKTVEEITRILNDVMEELDESYAISLDRTRIRNLVVRRTFFAKSKFSSYNKFLNKVSPQAIVEVVGYNLDCMVVNEIAKEKGITTIELQHGMITNRHSGYRYGGEHAIPQLPDKIWLFSDFFRSYINMPIKEDNVLTMGYPYFEQQVANNPREKQEKTGICFISQGTIGKQLSLLAVELAKQLDGSKYRIYYKLHPGEYAIWEQQYPWLKEADVEVIDNEGMNLYQVFARCDVQIGVYSTALLEGFGFGIKKTIIYKIYNSDMFEELCEKGYAQFVESVEECLSAICSEEVCMHDTFWPKESDKRMKEELEKYLKV